jgi:hypothetical protein
MKRRFIICGLFVFLLSMLTLIDTYGLFETNGEGTSNLEVGSWQILLNGTDVTVDEELSIDDFEYVTDSHTEEGVLAPGGVAELELLIDYSNVSTALTYEISFDLSALADFPNIVLKVYNDKTNEEITGETITGQCLLNVSDKTERLRMELEWQNDEDYDENDINVLEKNVSLSVHLHFSQLMEE